MASAISLKGLDVKGFVDELRVRMGEELDYRREAANQAEFAALYRDHPFIHVPDVVPEHSAERVITTEWAEGLTWSQFEATASPGVKQRAGEVLFRFAQGSVHRYGGFNGDPHPGNYRFHADGSITFLDFGLVKRWSPGEWERLSPCLDAILAHEPDRLVEAMVESRFLPEGHGLTPEAVFEYVSAPYVPYLTDRFTFSRSFTAEALSKVFDVNGPSAEVIRKLNMPPSFVILDRVVWGVSALLGKLGAEGPWRGILAEYRYGGPPVTELGRQDAQWRTGSGRVVGR
jgi:predicted unusual protein kinase regulating ubiquinone biosynthesis (AarF/ABC1/UbiB family)